MKRLLLKITALALTLCLAMSLAVTGMAAGSGTIADPYLISTAEELAAMGENLSAHYRLTANIDLGGAAWTPVGTKASPFTGSLDGAGFAVTGLNVSVSSAGNCAAGLFGYTEGASIKNLTVSGSVTAASSATAYAGGIAGRADSTAFANCTNKASVSGIHAGGIAGNADGTCSFTACSNGASVTGLSVSGSCVGGIVGFSSCENAESTLTLTLTGCVNTGSVCGNNFAGGLVGWAFNTAISDSANAAAVSATGTEQHAGGMAGGLWSASVSNCVNTGSVAADDYAGGIAGRADSSEISGAYYADTTPQGVGSGSEAGTKLSESAMTSPDSFPTLDFEDSWGMDPATGYPQPKGTEVLWNGGSITGTVSANASSAASLAEKAVVTAVSSADGAPVYTVMSTVGETETYTFENLPDGTYTVTVEKPRFAPVTMEITVSGGAATAPAAQLGLWGDVNGDGASTAYDASLILQHNVGLITLSSSQLFVGDVNGDGGTTAYDASLVLQINVGLISVFPVESK